MELSTLTLEADWALIRPPSDRIQNVHRPAESLSIRKSPSPHTHPALHDTDHGIVQLGFRSSNIQAKLQWGRDLSITESQRDARLRDGLSGFKGAAICRSRNRANYGAGGGGQCWLQWGRDLSITESRWFPKRSPCERRFNVPWFARRMFCSRIRSQYLLRSIRPSQLVQIVLVSKESRASGIPTCAGHLRSIGTLF